MLCHLMSPETNVATYSQCEDISNFTDARQDKWEEPRIINIAGPMYQLLSLPYL